MYKNKGVDGKNNLCGSKITQLRRGMTPVLSQEELSEQFCAYGININERTIEKIETGERFVTDKEILAFAKVFRVSVEELLYGKKRE